MRFTGRNARPIGQGTNLDRAGAVSGATVTQTTTTILTPGPGSTVGFNSQGVIPTSRDTGPVSQRTNLDRAGASGGATVAQTTTAIKTPSPGGAVGFPG